RRGSLAVPPPSPCAAGCALPWPCCAAGSEIIVAVNANSAAIARTRERLLKRFRTSNLFRSLAGLCWSRPAELCGIDRNIRLNVGPLDRYLNVGPCLIPIDRFL